MARARLALEPTLNETVYQEILQTIWDLGRTMERLPSTYADKDEETLRDHILLYLTPRFEGSSTGETFNKTGKTEIFVANKDFSAVLSSIRETMPNHAQFVRHVADHDESRFEYRFSLPGDPGREVWLTVVAFHLPKPGQRG